MAVKFDSCKGKTTGTCSVCGMCEDFEDSQWRDENTGRVMAAGLMTVAEKQKTVLQLLSSSCVLGDDICAAKHMLQGIKVNED